MGLGELRPAQNAARPAWAIRSATGFEGIHIWNIADPANPVYVRKLRMAATGNDAGAPAVGCGAHTATGVPDDARGHLYLYVGGSSGTCTGMDIVRISLTNPSDAVFLRRANANRQCHDNNVIMGTLNLAMCAGGNGFSVFKFDPALPAGRLPAASRTRRWSARVQVPEIGGGPAHSGSFSYDGKVLIFGWEPGGGTNPRCQANLSTSTNDNLLFFYDPATGNRLGTMTHTRPQSAIENCTWHNFNVVPDVQGLLRGLRQLPEGHLGHRLHQPGRGDRGRLRRSAAVRHELPADRR